MIIKDALLWGFETLTPTSDSPRLDAELLLAHVLKKPKSFLIAHDEQRIYSLNFWLFRRLIRKRKQGIPIAYLIGHKEFFMLDFKVNRHVLVPRPDTETLVESVITYLRALNPELRAKSLLLDVGTGSGCIPISVLKSVPGLTAVATDLSWRALRVAKQNTRRNAVGDRIQFVWSDLLSSVDPTEFEGSEVVLTANLPYLPDKIAMSPDLKFEPSLALYGGGDGIQLYKKFVQQIKSIKPKAIFLELFGWQAELVATWLPDYERRAIIPMSGEARCLFLERRA